MNNSRRPWWLLVNRPAGLVTTIHVESVPGQRRLIVRGEPVVQGLTWLTCGPISALLVIAFLTALAILVDVRAQGNIYRVLFIAAFLGLPALAWGITILIANRLSAPHLAAIRQADSQKRVIILDHRQGILSYNPSPSSEIHQIPYQQIQRVHVIPAIGAQDGTAVYLSLETDEGTIVLLGESLGSQAQKADLALEIDTAIQNHLRVKNPTRSDKTA